MFGIIAAQSIGTLFAAAIVPGLTQALFDMVAIAVQLSFDVADSG